MLIALDQGSKPLLPSHLLPPLLLSLVGKDDVSLEDLMKLQPLKLLRALVHINLQESLTLMTQMPTNQTATIGLDPNGNEMPILERRNS